MTIWKSIKQIPIEDVPITGKYAELFREIILRLEQTGPGFVLAVEMHSEVDAKNACCSLRPHLSRALGKGAVILTSKNHFLFVRRGENYPSNGAARPGA